MVKTVSRALVGQLVEIVYADRAKRATKYLSPSLTVKATYLSGRKGRMPYTTVMLTIGPPNYAERKFIKACKAAGETFPVKKIQIKG